MPCRGGPWWAMGAVAMARQHRDGLYQGASVESWQEHVEDRKTFTDFLEFRAPPPGEGGSPVPSPKFNHRSDDGPSLSGAAVGPSGGH
jgi:hypothetical protein